MTVAEEVLLRRRVEALQIKYKALAQPGEIEKFDEHERGYHDACVMVAADLRNVLG